ncbi:Acetylxylan esterase precursor [Vibrio aerogenes CECT 7868]|uniref:Acetylxylan esterase n=1 Tax=Vibrio aerogenes CECT 7868 TaxID=1216006 RepID=A0A1M6CHF0_9VIBR|nr:alpha/beta hydrolase [Vibrio aerogenes]SHI60460.1 Acetylxylan esterase precursor [Vibrio aerogenes CECT 7868]
MKSIMSKPFESLSQLSENKNVFKLWKESLQTNAALSPVCTERSTQPGVFDRALYQISEPEVLIVEPEQSNHTGILVIPGGGYQRIAVDKEGLEIAERFKQWGYTVFVISYRMPGDNHPQGADVSFIDAQRAMRVIQAQPQWQHIMHWGVLGFSAGGHIAARLATQTNQTHFPPQDQIDLHTIHLNFTALMYPVISMEPDIAHTGSRDALLGNPAQETLKEKYSVENLVSGKTPPCFIAHAIDDSSVIVENSMILLQALKSYQVPVEVHLFESGEHGFCLRTTPGTSTHMWPELLHGWIQQVPDTPV